MFYFTTRYLALLSMNLKKYWKSRANGMIENNLKIQTPRIKSAKKNQRKNISILSNSQGPNVPPMYSKLACIVVKNPTTFVVHWQVYYLSVLYIWTNSQGEAMTICTECKKKPNCDNVERCEEKQCPYKSVLARQERTPRRPASDRTTRAIEDTSSFDD